MAEEESSTVRFYIASTIDPTQKAEFEASRSTLTTKSLLSIAKSKLESKTAFSKVYFASGVAADDKRIASDPSIRDGYTFYVSDGSILNTSNDVIHVVMLGAGAVGKSALTLQFIQNQFVADYDPTIEDAYRKSITVDGSTIMLDILDTAGQEDFAALRGSWMRDKNGVVFVYSITDSESVDRLQGFHDQLLQVYDDLPHPKIVVVGNKCDMEDARDVSLTDAITAVEKWEAAEHMETSALLGLNVANMYGTLVRHIIAPRIRKQIENASKSSPTPKKWYSGCHLL